MAMAAEENMDIMSCSSPDTDVCRDVDYEKCVQVTHCEQLEHSNDEDDDDDTAPIFFDTQASSCAYCDKNDKVVAFCHTCESSLCTFCYDCHIRQKQYKTHNVVNFDDVAGSTLHHDITECPEKDKMFSSICTGDVLIQEANQLMTMEISKMEKQLSKMHGKLEQAVKKLAIQVEKATDKLCDFYTEVLHNAKQQKEQNMERLHTKAFQLENINLTQLKDVESVQKLLQSFKKSVNDTTSPEAAQTFTEIMEKYKTIMTQSASSTSLEFLSSDPQTVSLGEIVCTNSECNDAQEYNKAEIPVFHDLDWPVAGISYNRPRSNSVFKLPSIKRKLKRNKSDGSIKRHRISVINSKDGPAYHINLIKWPKRIIKNGGKMGRVFGLGFSKAGVLAVTDYNNHCVHVYNAHNELIKILGGKGKGNSQFEHPVGVAFDNKGCLYVSEYGNHRVQKFDSNFEYMLQFGDEGNDDGQLNHPMGIAAYKDKVYVADSANSRIAVFYTSGKFCSNVVSGCLRDPYDVAISRTSRRQLFVTDSACCVRTFLLDGTYTNRFSGFGADRGQLNHPVSLAIDSNGFVFVADTYNHRISIFDNDGMFVRSFGSSGNNEEQFNRPQGIAFNPANGNLYVSDYGNQRVMIFPTKFKGQKHLY